MQNTARYSYAEYRAVFFLVWLLQLTFLLVRVDLANVSLLLTES